MAFFETPRFPDRLAMGAVGGPGFATDVVQTVGGAEQRNAKWAYPLHSWDVSAGVKTASDFALLRAHFMAARGRLHAWRYKDWADYTAAGTEGVLIGSGGPTAQLTKRYTIGAQSLDRKISKPVTAALTNNGTPLTAGSAYTLDTTTGLVTWLANGSSAVTGVTVGATTQVTLASAIASLGAGDRLYLSGLAGADAALLNGAAWLINSVATATYTLAAVTTGKTITAAGTGATYPGSRAADTLAWTGEFDVPMRFDTDKLAAKIADRARDGLLHLWDSIPVTEVRL